MSVAERGYHLCMAGDGLHVLRCPREEDAYAFVVLNIQNGQPVGVGCENYRSNSECLFNAGKCIFGIMEAFKPDNKK